jgi:hydroxyethylthiazole kinase-like uncharacterized protein yjeF
LVKVVTVEEMRALEQAADAQGVSYAAMMEAAGRSVAHWLQSKGVVGKRVLVLVGPGNNGGDGLVAARHLHEAGADVSIYCWKRETDDDTNWSQAKDAGIPIVLCQADERFARLRRLVAESDWILDALLGTGVSRPITGSLQRLLTTVSKGIAKRRANRTASLFTHLVPMACADKAPPPFVVAVDVPTGLNCDTGTVDPVALSADATITFAFPKAGQFLFPGADYVGELIIADIGIPAVLSKDIALEVSTPERVRLWLPPRPADGHKGTFGKVMVVGGSTNYTGAVYLAASAAIRVGAGLVTLAVAESLHPILASKLTEATWLLLPHQMGALMPEATKPLWERLGDYDALLLGPGLGRDEKTVEFVSRLLELPGADTKPQLGFLQPAHREGTQPSLPTPLVIDADGLNALAGVKDWAKALSVPTVLTPHPGEMARLLDVTVGDVQANRIEVARRAAKEWRAVVVLKGAYSVIASPAGTAYINPFATPALATAGTGDVLAGAIAGLLAQGLGPLGAAVVGAYVHGLAGQLVGEELGMAGAAAGDLLVKLPLGLRSIAAV